MSAPELLIWNEMRDRLIGFVSRYIKDKCLAEDIVHDVFLKVYDKLPQLRDSEKTAAWIYRIARNRITDYYRSKAKEGTAVHVDWDSDGTTLNDCVSRCLQDMIPTLPNKYREALELADLNAIPQRELSRRLNLSYSAVKSRVQRARQILRKKMQQAYHIRFDQYGNALECETALPCGCS